MVAPTPVSALLHAVAVVKAGVFSVLKVVVYIFGLELLQTPASNAWLAYVAGATIIIASLVAARTTSSSGSPTVSPLSYQWSSAPCSHFRQAWSARLRIAMHAFMDHAVLLPARSGCEPKTEISEMQGLGWRMPFTFTAFFLASLIIGLPMGGAWNEWGWRWAPPRPNCPGRGADDLSLLNVAYLIPVAARAFMPAAGRPARRWQIQGRRCSASCPQCLTALGIVLFFYADRLYAFLQPIGRLRQWWKRPGRPCLTGSTSRASPDRLDPGHGASCGGRGRVLRQARLRSACIRLRPVRVRRTWG
jgi:multicomponent Na+:H+ antiporter subunit D